MSIPPLSPPNGILDPWLHLECQRLAAMRNKLLGIQAMSADLSLPVATRLAASAELQRLRVAYVRAMLKCTR